MLVIQPKVTIIFKFVDVKRFFFFFSIETVYWFAFSQITYFM